MKSPPEEHDAAGHGYQTKFRCAAHEALFERTVMTGRPELAVARAGDGGADAVDDLVCFALGDLDELVLQVAAFGRE